METEEIYALMMEALDGELSEDGLAELELHLRARPNLAREWQALQAIDSLLSHAPVLAPAEGFARRTVARLPATRQRLWLGVIAYLLLLAGGVVPVAALAWAALNLLPASVSVLLRSLWQAAVELVDLAATVLEALLSGAGELVAQQPALGGWLLLMVAVVVAWVAVYHRLVFQAERV
ncbi:MAG: hypothetical protein R3272_03565 [Candidatus Promineifilaceae bacterium]|nr:hypothetical protein [Candidatus Promineifilaceae bacterium]